MEIPRTNIQRAIITDKFMSENVFHSFIFSLIYNGNSKTSRTNFIYDIF